MGSLPPPELTSRHNPKVLLAASLSRRKERERLGLVLVEGERLVAQALAFGARFHYFLLDRERVSAGLLAAVRASGADVFFATEAVLAKAAETKSPQGIVGVAAAQREDAVDLAAAGWLVVADGLQDPGNLGTVLRVAAAVGADGVVCTAGSVDPKHPRCLRASAGAYFRARLSTGWAPAALHEALVEQGFTIVAADAAGEADAFAYPWEGRIALVLGSEARGPDPALVPHVRVRIPMPGGGESLNVGAAAAVLLYQAWRARERGARL